MGEVINADFGDERAWRSIRERLHIALREAAEVCGDDPELMDRKAECAYVMLRQIVDDLPKLSHHMRRPANIELSQEAQGWILEEVQKTVIKAIDHAQKHAIGLLMDNIYELCTSLLTKK